MCTALSLRKVEDESHVRIALCDTNGFRRFRPREMSGATSTNIVQVQTQSEKGENDGRWTGGRVDRGERVRDVTRKQFLLSNIRYKCYFIQIHSFFSLHGTSMYL